MKENILKIKEYYEEIAGDWNGEDEEFMSGGEIYHEEDAQNATEIVEKCDELLALIENV